MKPQDIAFFVLLVILIFLKRRRYFVIAGLLCFAFAIPLFATWTFFTGERLTWYGAAFILISLLVK